MKNSWLSPAKINLFLYITGQRKDGYHLLQTLFQFLNYGDILTIIPRSDGQIHLLTPLEGIINKDNLIIRAARLLMKVATRNNRLLIGSGANIFIKKRLPIGGGLGGGSSNAATTLVVLNQLWKCGFTERELAELGLKLSSDIPVFIYGHAAFAEGIGELLYPISLPEKWYLVVYPNLRISTKLVFQDPELPRNTPKRSIKTLLKCKFSNDCESVVRKRFQEVDATFSWLLRYDAPSRLTGTGSCVLAEFASKSAAYQVLVQTPRWLNSFVAQGINLSPLKRAISGYT